MIDNAQTLIEEYSKTAISVSIYLSTILPEISKKLENLPFTIKKHSQAGEKVGNQENYKFSTVHKKYIYLIEFF